jgi:hypothetical protein
MSNRARSALSSATTAVTLGFVFLCLGATLWASAQISTNGLARPARSEKAIPTFRNVVGRTEIERMILSSGLGCLTRIEINGKEFAMPQCHIVQKLRDALLKVSENESLSTYLERNNFKCTKVKNGTRCHNTFKVIESPRHPITGAQVNPDFENTFTTDVWFSQTNARPMAAQDIRVNFDHVAKQFHN